MSIIFIFASMIKHDFHEDEKEWRFLILTRNGDKNIKQIKRSNQERPVYDLKLPFKTENAFEGIKLGPHEINNNEALHSLFNLIESQVGFTIQGMTRSRGEIR